jgi:hypothetical protein
MKTTLLTRLASLLPVVPMLLSAQLLRDSVPLRHWTAPLYWQLDHTVAEFRPLATAPSDPNPLTFIGMTPCRVVDTRVGFGFSGVFGPPALVGGVSRTFPMQSSSTCSIPATAQAYSLNVTVVPHGPLGYLTAYPTGQPQPVVSTLNSDQGFIVANAAIVPAGTSGSIDIFVSNSTDLVMDINGYYAASFGTPSGGYSFPNASGTPLMTIAPGGNVGIGIGTATPGSALDVTGDINLTGILRLRGGPLLQAQGSLTPPPTGVDNLGVGIDALSSNTGNSNMAIGNYALIHNNGVGYNNIGGTGNTALGLQALSANIVGDANTATGYQALFNSSTGAENTATGYGALYYNTTGGDNTAIGLHALINNVSGSQNIAIGAAAGQQVATGSNNIDIGNDGAPGDGTSASSGVIRIGNSAQTSFFVAGVAGTPVIGVPVLINTSTGQLGVASSSRRYKEDIQDMGDASSGLMHLRPVSFRYQKPFADGSKPIQYGLIAEEVAEVYPDLVAHSADGQIETVKYQVLDSMLLNEVQRLNKENLALQERLSRLEAIVASGAEVQ